MRVVKPNVLSVLARPVEHRGAVRFCVSVMAMAPLRGGPFLYSEQTLWRLLPDAAPGFMEAGILKSRSEYLVYGHVRPPADAGDASKPTPFGVRLGNLRKVGRAFGRRVVDRDKLVHREPPGLAPVHGPGSYGGPEYVANPLGRGHPSSRRPDGLLDLPLIEGPDKPWDPRPDRNESFSFGARDITHPERMALAGTYDREWLETDFPGLAKDGKWALHNIAAPDQQQPDPFAGDEEFHLANLHPTDPQLRGRLPGLCAAVLIERVDDAVERLPMNLRTVVFLPDQDRVLMIWQGYCTCRFDDGTDVGTVLAGLEHLDQRRSTAHYAEVLSRRSEGPDDLLETLNDAPLLPDGVPFEGLLPADLDLNRPLPDDSFEARQLRRAERQMQDARDEVTRAGLDPDEHAPPAKMPPVPPLPPIHELGEYFRKIEEGGKRLTEQMQARFAREMEAVRKIFTDQGKDFAVIEREMTGVDSLGPPQPFAAQREALIRQERESAVAAGVPTAGLDLMLADPDLKMGWEREDETLLEAYCASAHQRGAPPAPDAATTATQRKTVADRMRTGGNLSGYDLTAADFRGLDLRGADFSRALLAGANFADTQLGGAKFDGAVLAHADLGKAQAQGASFSGANLGRARLQGIDASDADFSNAVLFETGLGGARLQRARFRGAEVYTARFENADLGGADLSECQFLDNDFSGARLDGAVLDEAAFVSAKLENTSWIGARGRNLALVHIACPNSSFRTAALPGSRWVGKVDLSGCCFDEADLSHAYVARGSNLTGASFVRVKADNADFSGCVLENSRWNEAVLREVGFRHARLARADFTGANLMGAAFASAFLHGASLRQCSLYAADLARIQVDERTRIEDAYSARTRVFPRWRPPPESA